MTENRSSGIRKAKANPVSLTNLLVPVLDNLGLGPDIRLEKLKHNWHEIVGTMNARNTSPLSLRNGILAVGVSSAVWMTQARFYSSAFLQKINSFESEDGIEVKEIHFTLARSQRSNK